MPSIQKECLKLAEQTIDNLGASSLRILLQRSGEFFEDVLDESDEEIHECAKNLLYKNYTFVAEFLKVLRIKVAYDNDE